MGIFIKHGKFTNLKSKPHFPQKREKLEFLRAIVGIKELIGRIGLWAIPEDAE